jgi:proteasome lid subunit RPN8/RPN11
VIRLSAALAERIGGEGIRTYPNECCGVLLGRASEGPDGPVREVSDILPIENARELEERYHRFVIEPLDYLRAETAARERGLDVLGFYHSHPDHPAKPSDYDREHAWPNLSYVVAAVAGRPGEGAEVRALTSWELSGDRSEFWPEPVTT